MGFPDQRPPAGGGYQDDATIPDSGSYLDGLSPMDCRGSGGDLADRYEDTAGEDDEVDYIREDDFDDLGDLGDELYDEGGEYDPAGQPREADWHDGQADGRGLGT